MHRHLLVYCLLGFLSASCGDDDDRDDLLRLLCGPEIEIIDVLVTREFDTFRLISANVEGLCLEVVIEGAGCKQDDWSLDLLTFGEVMKSNPTQTSARLIFDDGLPDGFLGCLTVARKTYSYDLMPYLGPRGVLPTNLTLTGTGTIVSVD